MTERTHSAIFSMHGEAHQLATTRTRECVAMPGVRNQVVLTPEPVRAGLRKFWPSGVEYDPCHGEGSLVNARRRTTTRGLIDPYPHRTYCNPPYGTSLHDPEKEMGAYLLEQEIRADAKERGVPASFAGWPDLPVKKAGLWDWLAMQINMSMGESILLVPNRTNRRWLRAWRRRVTAKIELDPLAFHGQAQSAPFPLVLGFVGPESRTTDFHQAFAHLGDPA